jgi:hypothetical protein
MSPCEVFVQTCEEEKWIDLKIASHDAALPESARSSEPEMEPHSFMDTVGFQLQVSALEQHALNVLQNFTDDYSFHREAPSDNVRQERVLQEATVGAAPFRTRASNPCRSKRKARSLITMAFKAQQRAADREANEVEPQLCGTSICSHCGGQTMPEFKFCRFCGQATSGIVYSAPLEEGSLSWLRASV